MANELKDLRNHGSSPAAPEADYAHLAADVAETVKEQGIGDVSVLGHSMQASNRFRIPRRTADACRNRGGKVAMALALSEALPLRKLIGEQRLSSSSDAAQVKPGG